MPSEFAGIKLKNPFISASGCMGYGWEAEEESGPLKWGAVVTKTISPLPKEGNPPPRIFETESGIINRVGLQNCGLEEFKRTHIPKLTLLPYPFIVSIYSDSTEGWKQLAAEISDSGAAALELNLSCPNLSGRRVTEEPGECVLIAGTVKRISKIPVIAKINAFDSPGPLSTALEQAGADALVCSNTIPAGVYKNGVFFQGGLSGPAIKPVVLKALAEICAYVKIDVAACGGICSIRDAEDYLKAGAAAFQIGSALLKDPGIINQLAPSYREGTGRG